MHLRLLFFVKRIEVFMRKMRLELTRGNPHKNLNLARLPIPTLPRICLLGNEWIIQVMWGSVKKSGVRYGGWFSISRQGGGELSSSHIFKDFVLTTIVQSDNILKSVFCSRGGIGRRVRLRIW